MCHTAPLRIPRQASPPGRPNRPTRLTGLDVELRLLEAVHAYPDPDPDPTSTGAHTATTADPQLAEALRQGDLTSAEARATLLWRDEGLAVAHAALSLCLHEASRAESSDAAPAERTVAAAVRAVLERLRSAAPPPRQNGTVVVASVPDDPHVMALSALAHHVQDAGYRALVVDDLPLEELVLLVARPETIGVVLSAHVMLSREQARSIVTSLRSAAPELLVATGGPGMPPGLRGVDLQSNDPAELARVLEGWGHILTTREREVLLLVADGLTNNDIGTVLGLSPATVKSHLDHVFTKTGTEHRAAAVARSLRQGWIS